MVASPIEADADECRPDLRQALPEANAGLARATTQEKIFIKQSNFRSVLFNSKWHFLLKPAFSFHPVFNLKLLDPTKVFHIVCDDDGPDSPCVGCNHEISRTELSSSFFQVCANL